MFIDVYVHIKAENLDQNWGVYEGKSGSYCPLTGLFIILLISMSFNLNPMTRYTAGQRYEVNMLHLSLEHTPLLLVGNLLDVI